MAGAAGAPTAESPDAGAGGRERTTPSPSATAQEKKDDWADPEFARAWDGADVERTNPDRARQVGLLVALVAERHAEAPGRTLLDLGSGSGLVEARLFAAAPDATVVGVDGSRAMIDLARERLAPHGARFTCVHADLAELDLPRQLPPGAEVNCVFSSQTLHEVPHDVKRRVFRAVRGVLPPDGVFYILERYQLAGARFHADLGSVWRRLNAAAGVADSMTFAEYLGDYLGRGYDHTCTLAEMTRWLEDAGFEVAVLYQHFTRALLRARPQPPPAAAGGAAPP